MRLRRSVAALGLAGVGSLLAAGCGGSSSMNGTDAGMPDMAIGGTIKGMLNGPAPMVGGVHSLPDATCGSRGIEIFFAETPDRGCAPDASNRLNLRIHVSDHAITRYSLTTSVHCPANPGDKSFYATYHQEGDDAGTVSSDFDSFPGITGQVTFVDVTYYDGVAISGEYDIAFSQRSSPTVPAGEFKGKFTAIHCP